ncbi:hypothetical protein SARC_09400 [Sphaeroforma arctica JP610]|uniref:Polysaccharide lyase 14 domain-containing protein n=1 Tax=Sphaeroforma arctica JP610 TaxID=667725 RepID=A0A0L0FNX1_9EUKA|nr:hypothetical protein SARC_09400 [Sphaeroforma arctica JP610]KNC78156.1 hypothetical protein SARC_09400 [Sphaeroforma arctica JP610]|eukprot:XP_014152058.1 hypothetical protein SARC_09400 [Sphaeroforma arctica JP610]
MLGSNIHIKSVVVGLLSTATRQAYGAVALSQVMARWDFNGFDKWADTDIGVGFDASDKGCFGNVRHSKLCSSNYPANNRVVPNPEAAGENVMEILYQGGKYGTDKNHGAGFYTEQLQGQESEAAVLEYQVYFPRGFDFVLGGKLPGLYGGGKTCSGLRPADGENCFSSRLMWRENGMGESYMYIPTLEQTDDFCSRCHNMKDKCESEHPVCSLERGKFTFQTGRWTTVRQHVQLNDADEQNGLYQLYINDILISEEKSIRYRTTNELTIGGMFFSTFFGGGSEKYAPQDDQKAFFRGFRLYNGFA